MTGDEHYTEAERLAAEAGDALRNNLAGDVLVSNLAQVEIRIKLARLHVELAEYSVGYLPGINLAEEAQ